MNALASFTDALREPPLERRLPVFIGELDAPLPVRVLFAETLQGRADGLQIAGRQQPLRAEHARMRDRSAHVIGDQPLVQRVILAGGELKYPLVERCAFIPESCHASSMAVRPAAIMGCRPRLSCRPAVRPD